MLENNEKKQDESELSDKPKDEPSKDRNKKENETNQSIEDKLKETEDKLLRSLAEIEIKDEGLKRNQRRFRIWIFNFAKESLAILDNLQRAKEAIKTIIN